MVIFVELTVIIPPVAVVVVGTVPVGVADGAGANNSVATMLVRSVALVVEVHVTDLRAVHEVGNVKLAKPALVSTLKVCEGTLMPSPVVPEKVTAVSPLSETPYIAKRPPSLAVSVYVFVLLEVIESALVIELLSERSDVPVIVKPSSLYVVGVVKEFAKWRILLRLLKSLYVAKPESVRTSLPASRVTLFPLTDAFTELAVAEMFRELLAPVPPRIWIVWGPSVERIGTELPESVPSATTHWTDAGFVWLSTIRFLILLRWSLVRFV